MKSLNVRMLDETKPAPDTSRKGCIKRLLGLGVTPQEIEGIVQRNNAPDVTPQYPAFSTVAVIGDCHDDPELEKDRFHLLGRFLLSKRPDVIVLIGDFMTFDSCNSHEKNHTRKGKLKTPILEDCQSADKAMEALMSTIAQHDGYNPQLVATLGNHENRFERFINENPETAGMFEMHVVPVFAKWGFETVRYGEWWFYGDMGYTHIPFNGGGAPYGGVNAGRKIAQDSCHHVTHGHLHGAYCVSEPKLITGNHQQQHGVTVTCTGGFMPTNFREDYAKNSKTHWTSLVHIQKFLDGKYQSHEQYSLDELEHMFKG